MKKSGKSENVQVVVRVRPMNRKEREEQKAKEVVRLDFSTNSIYLEEAGLGLESRGFTFDAVYNNTFTQRDVFQQSILPVVETVLAGYNATIFAYGQSGTGKTYSMCGDLDNPAEQGIIPQALNLIFNTINSLRSATMEYKVKASFVELYNGKCRDLLVDGRLNLDLKENAQKLFYVKDLTINDVADTAAAMALMENGLTRRETKSTELNSDSSRSHSVFTVYVRTHDKVADLHTEAKLLLVDLAGSERVSKSGATGETLIEGTNINLSLTALGTVIDCLVKAKPHIPYRSSPLTMLLKDGLGGNSRTVIVGTCSPADYSAHETLSTLRFVDRAKQIKNKPKVQMDPKDARIHDLLEEIKALRTRLGLGEDGAGDAGTSEAALRQNYAQSFEQELESLRRRVEELEVQLAAANEALALRQQDIERAEAGFARERAALNEAIASAELRAREVAEATSLQEAVEDRDVAPLAASNAAGSHKLNELLRLCAAYLRHTHRIEKEPSFAGITEALKGIMAAPAVGGSPVRSGDSGSLERIPHPPAEGAGPQSGRAPPGRNAVSAPTGSEDRSSPRRRKNRTGSVVEIAIANAADGSRIAEADIRAAIDGAGVRSGEERLALQSAIAELLEKQRTAIHCSIAEYAGSNPTQQLQGAHGFGTADEATALLRASYDHASQELSRATAALQKQKELSRKAKEIAEKRSAENKRLAADLATAAAQVASLQSRHQTEWQSQQDAVAVEFNRKMDAAVQKHAAALHKERKLRDAVQAQLAAAEDKYRALEQQYDVKLAEYDSLAEALERSQAAGLRRVREGAGAAGDSASLYPARRDNFMAPQNTQQALVERMRQQANRDVPPSGTMALLQGLRK